METSFREFFKDHIAPYASFPRDERPFFELLIALQDRHDHHLFKAAGTSVREVEANGDCIGSGTLLAKSLIEKLYSPFMALDEIVIAACYIMFQTKKYADGCGGNTHLYVSSHKYDFFGRVSPPAIAALESRLEEFDEMLCNLLTAFPNSNLSEVEFAKRLTWVQEWMLKTRKDMFASGGRFFEVLSRLNSKPLSSPPADGSQ